MAVKIINDAPERSSLETLVALFNKLVADVAEIRTKYNAHTNKENADTVYTKDASTAAPATAEKAAVATTDTITLLK